MKDGGLLEQLLFTLTVEAMPGNIPVVDRGRRRRRSRIGDQLRVEDIPLPAGVDDAGRARHVVAQVAAPRVVTEEAEEGEEGEGVEGEAGRRRREAPDRRGRRTTPATSNRCSRRRGTAADLLVVGLGNPGDEYARTRHNVGAEVVELLATRHGATLRKGKERALRRRGAHRRRSCVALAIPLTYMNDSGLAVARCWPAATAWSPSRSWSCTTSSTCRSARSR